MNSLRLALQFLRREWRSGELMTLTVSLVLAVTAVLTITLVTDRLTSAMTRESAELIGGDAVISSSREPDDRWIERGSEMGLRNTQVYLFDSVVFNGDNMLLASVKAVGDNYPLIGQLEIKSAIDADTEFTRAIPAPGTAWVDPRVLDQLAVAPGDEILFGAIALTVEKLVIFEPDQAGSLFQFAPRVLVNAADLPAAQVLGPGSRIRYRNYFSGERAAEFIAELGDDLGTGHRLITPAEDDNRASEALAKTTMYIRLATLLTLILAAIAIALTARRYAERHRNTSAIIRCYGGQQRAIGWLFAYQLLFLTLAATAVAAVAGWLCHSLVLELLRPLLPLELPAPSATPWITACTSAFLLTGGFALPPLLRLSNTPPLRVLRQDLNPPPLSMWLAYGLTGASQFTLVFLLFRDISGILLIMLAAGAALLILGWLVYRLLQALKSLSGETHSLLARSARNLANQAATTTTQILAFSLTLMLMVLLTQLRGDLLSEWRLQLPENAPNHFVFNLFPHQTEQFTELASEYAQLNPLYPVVRGRIVAINGNSEAVRAGGDNRRELNFTWTDALPKDNEITAGQWPPQAGEISVEQEYAGRLGLDIGDSVTIDVNGSHFDVTVSSLRSVEWESFSPNFYLIFNRESLASMPTSYLTSLYVEGDNRPLIRALRDNFPALTIIEVDNIIERMAVILSQVSLSVEVILVFVLLGGFAVLFATLQTTADQRRHEGALLRALGASRRYLKRAYLCEFGLIGVIAGAIAALGAEIITAVIYHFAFNLTFTPSPLLWLAAPLGMGATVAVAGYLGSRKVMAVSPGQLLAAS